MYILSHWWGVICVLGRGHFIIVIFAFLKMAGHFLLPSVWESWQKKMDCEWHSKWVEVLACASLHSVNHTESKEQTRGSTYDLVTTIFKLRFSNRSLYQSKTWLINCFKNSKNPTKTSGWQLCRIWCCVAIRTHCLWGAFTLANRLDRLDTEN